MGEEEEEEMRSPGRAHPLPAPTNLGAVIGGMTPLGLPGSASGRRLSSSSPSHGYLTHATPLRSMLRVPFRPARGGLAGIGSASRHPPRRVDAHDGCEALACRYYRSAAFGPRVTGA